MGFHHDAAADRVAGGGPLRLLCVHAHPDDESSKGAAAMAKYVAEGARVMVATCTGGERGDILNKQLLNDPEVLRDITEYRRHEMASAVAILGIEHEWMGFVDSGLPQGDPLPPLPAGCFALEPLNVTTEVLVRVIREFRPHVMTTYDETGGYPHPDHIMCHTVSMAAFEAAGDASRYPKAGPAWQPQKLYYNQSHSTARLRAMHEALIARDGESPFAEWLGRREAAPERPITARLDCRDYLPVALSALQAHATQIDPDGAFFALSPEELAAVWPWEDYELGRSLVPTEPFEDDLFAGLR